MAGPLAIGRDAVEDVFRTLALERTADRLHNPGLDPARVDSVLGRLLRGRRHHAAAAPARRHGRSTAPGGVMARHPSISASPPSALRLTGRRVLLRPLQPVDFAEQYELSQAS